jgi:hypothetical protein
VYIIATHAYGGALIKVGFRASGEGGVGDLPYFPASCLIQYVLFLAVFRHPILLAIQSNFHSFYSLAHSPAHSYLIIQRHNGTMPSIAKALLLFLVVQWLFLLPLRLLEPSVLEPLHTLQLHSSFHTTQVLVSHDFTTLPTLYLYSSYSSSYFSSHLSSILFSTKMPRKVLRVERLSPDHWEKFPPPVDQELWKNYMNEDDSDTDISDSEKDEMPGPASASKSAKSDALEAKVSKNDTVG